MTVLARQADMVRDAQPIPAAPRTTGARTLLRFITCGSVDDGKSTLIGRLLFDTNALAEDQIATLREDSAKAGRQGDIDYSLLLDGLAAEREQGITIDVAYRYFSTPKRAFIVADTPGHEQYTRNMATGASTAELAILLIDARKGLLPQTRRHAHIAAMLGVRHVVLAINKMDLVDYSQGLFDAIDAEFRAFAAPLGFETLVAVPLSAKLGDNVGERSGRMVWYRGPTLLDVLETASTNVVHDAQSARFVVQWVNRPRGEQGAPEGIDFRGFSGFVATGRLNVGDEIIVQPSGQGARVARLVTYDGDVPHANAGAAVTVVLDRHVDVSRGDVLTAGDDTFAPTQEIDAKLLWMGQQAFDPSRSLLMKIGARTVPVRVDAGSMRVFDISNGEPAKGDALSSNDIARATLMTEARVFATPYPASRDLGGFILIDRLSHETVALGMIEATGSGATATAQGGLSSLATAASRRVAGAVDTVLGQPADQARRSFAKAITWRATGSLDTFVLAYLFTGQAKIAAGISMAEIVTKIVLYYGHERIWTRIGFGRAADSKASTA